MKLALALLAAPILVPCLLADDAPPNFSGTWKLNVAESDYSDKRAVVPDRLVLTS